ncbi:MAG: polysaccharide biosynthesis/export family protein, partial [Pseudomonadota bacterium]
RDVTSPDNLPAPKGYVVGPGDTVRLSLFGSRNSEYSLTISRDGVLTLPDVGPVNVTGMTFDALREDVSTRLTEQIIGVGVALSLEELRSIQVFVVGDVRNPGAHLMPASSTVLDALFRARGVSEGGSLRRIEVMRNQRRVGRLDLYELLLKGATRGDVSLRAGDVIFVPTVGDQVAVGGEVRRPAVYELNGERDVAAVLALAGGALPSAYLGQATIERFMADGRSTVVSFEVPRAGQFDVRAGDFVSIDRVLADYNDVVWLKGYAERPGPVQMTPGMRLLDLIRSPAELKAGVDLDYVLIRREVGPERRVELASANLREALRNPGGPENVTLAARDQVYALALSGDRAEIIKPLIEEVQEQASSTTAPPVVSVTLDQTATRKVRVQPELTGEPAVGY